MCWRVSIGSGRSAQAGNGNGRGSTPASRDVAQNVNGRADTADTCRSRARETVGEDIAASRDQNGASSGGIVNGASSGPNPMPSVRSGETPPVGLEAVTVPAAAVTIRALGAGDAGSNAEA
jgi:hypothetical protein